MGDGESEQSFINADSAGQTATKYVQLFEAPGLLRMANGEHLGPVTVAYETYGELNSDKSNAIFVCHALTGDAHAAACRRVDALQFRCCQGEWLPGLARWC